MRKTSIIIFLLIFIVACEDKKPKETHIHIENTTEVLEPKSNFSEENHKFKLKQKKPKQSIEPTIQDTISTFDLLDKNQKPHKVSVSKQKVIFHQQKQGIVLFNIFTTWCPSCVGMIPYLNDLQKKYNKDLFVASVLSHDPIQKDALHKFIAKHKINYFISQGTSNDAFVWVLAKNIHLPQNFSIPLSILYVNGEYFTHYEGAVPIEMIEYDIQEAKKQLKRK